MKTGKTTAAVVEPLDSAEPIVCTDPRDEKFFEGASVERQLATLGGLLPAVLREEFKKIGPDPRESRQVLLEPLIAAKAKARQATSTGGVNPQLKQTSAEAGRVETRQERLLGQLVSRTTPSRKGRAIALALLLEPLIAAKAKARQAHGATAPGRTLKQTSAEASAERVETRQEVKYERGRNQFPRA